MVESGPGAGRVVVLTVGHGVRPIEDFVDLLRAAGVRRLVDVRTAPGSRRNPQFGRDALERALGAAGIDYVWRRELGGFRRPAPDSPNVAIQTKAFRGYADHMATQEFRDALRWLIETSRGTPTAIMCAESLWWRCHRRMIADALVVEGCGVVHLVPGGRREPHRLHPNLRIAQGRLVYDVIEGQVPLPIPQGSVPRPRHGA